MKSRKTKQKRPTTKDLWEAYDALDPVKRSIASINIAFLFKFSHARMEENDEKDENK